MKWLILTAVAVPSLALAAESYLRVDRMKNDACARNVDELIKKVKGVTASGCEGGCGTRSEDARAVVQPGAKSGQRAYCPVSGVVFEIGAKTPKADVNGKTLYFCCEGCARHFAVAREEVLARRKLALR